MVEENEFDEKVESGQVEDVTPKEESQTQEVGEVLELPPEDIVILSKLKQFKQSQDTVPTANPRVLLDQDIHFKSGSVYRVYRFITDVWQKIFDSSDYTDLTDGGATTLHKHDHGSMDGLGDDDHPLYLKDFDLGDQLLQSADTERTTTSLSSDPVVQARATPLVRCRHTAF